MCCLTDCHSARDLDCVVCEDADEGIDTMEMAGCLVSDLASSIEERGVVAVEEGVVADIVMVCRDELRNVRMILRGKQCSFSSSLRCFVGKADLVVVGSR